MPLDESFSQSPDLSPNWGPNRLNIAKNSTITSCGDSRIPVGEGHRTCLGDADSDGWVSAFPVDPGPSSEARLARVFPVVRSRRPTTRSQSFVDPGPARTRSAR